MKVPSRAWKALCERVRDVVRASALNQDHDLVRDEVTHVVAPDVNVASELAIDGVEGDLDTSC
eukprot:222459-Rhodomonas_salina.1